jgi:exodeoxyribonuclease VII large subunit
VTVIEAGASVQGDGAADEIVMAIDIVNRLTQADVILLVRGGGAPEELAAFNDERLARAIFASRIPVITGIGHQTDQSIADLVADHRAATPSLAAAAAVPDAASIVQAIGRLHAQLGHIVGERLRSDRRRWIQLNRALVQARPETKLRAHHRKSNDLIVASRRALENQLGTKRARLAGLRAQLEVLDPLAILARGYAVLTDVDGGRVVSSAGEVTAGRLLNARVADGEIRVRVEKP